MVYLLCVSQVSHYYIYTSNFSDSTWSKPNNALSELLLSLCRYKSALKMTRRSTWSTSTYIIAHRRGILQKRATWVPYKIALKPNIASRGKMYFLIIISRTRARDWINEREKCRWPHSRACNSLIKCVLGLSMRRKFHSPILNFKHLKILTYIAMRYRWFWIFQARMCCAYHLHNPLRNEESAATTTTTRLWKYWEKRKPRALFVTRPSLQTLSTECLMKRGNPKPSCGCS